MNGLLVLDKPEGITSHDAVRIVRRLCKTRKVGHSGTLDPMATGVLLVAVGEGTRLLQFLVVEDKTYRATLRLGEVTDTQDREGTVLERRPVDNVTQETLDEVFKKFSGRINQTPPMYSALKQDGVPLHRLARMGVEVERTSRQIDIQRLEICDVDLPYVTFEVECSKGTYIRTLAHDIGMALGTGACLVSLRRLRNGSFEVKDALTIESLEEACAGDMIPLIPMENILRGLPKLFLDDDAAMRLKNGIPPSLDGVTGLTDEIEGDMVTFHYKGRLGGVAKYAPSRISELRGDFELLRVFPDKLCE